MKTLRTFAVITFKGGKTKKVFGYTTALDVIADFDNCLRVDIFKERHNNEAADLIDYAENDKI